MPRRNPAVARAACLALTMLLVAACGGARTRPFAPRPAAPPGAPARAVARGGSVGVARGTSRACVLFGDHTGRCASARRRRPAPRLGVALRSAAPARHRLHDELVLRA